MTDEKGLSLEEAVNQTHELRRDLSAEIVIQEEKGHFSDEDRDEFIDEYTKRADMGYMGATLANCPTMARNEAENSYCSSYIIDQPAITEPDTQKIKLAKHRLFQIYGSSKWLSARYSAGLALFEEFKGIGKKVMLIKLNLCVDELRENLNSLSGQSPDDEKRVNAVRDIAKLYSMSQLPILEQQLKDVYANNTSENARREAAAQLGYSKARVWLHEKFRRE